MSMVLTAIGIYLVSHIVDPMIERVLGESIPYTSSILYLFLVVVLYMVALIICGNKQVLSKRMMAFAIYLEKLCQGLKDLIICYILISVLLFTSKTALEFVLQDWDLVFDIAVIACIILQRNKKVE